MVRPGRMGGGPQSTELTPLRGGWVAAGLEGAGWGEVISTGSRSRSASNGCSVAIWSDRSVCPLSDAPAPASAPFGVGTRSGAAGLLATSVTRAGEAAAGGTGATAAGRAGKAAAGGTGATAAGGGGTGKAVAERGAATRSCLAGNGTETSLASLLSKTAGQSSTGASGSTGSRYIRRKKNPIPIKIPKR